MRHVQVLTRPSVHAGWGYCVPKAQRGGALACAPGSGPDACAPDELCFVERFSAEPSDAGASLLPGGESDLVEGGSLGGSHLHAGGGQGPSHEQTALREVPLHSFISHRWGAQLQADAACGPLSMALILSWRPAA